MFAVCSYGGLTIFEDESNALVLRDGLVDRVIVSEHVRIGDLHPAFTRQPSLNAQGEAGGWGVETHCGWCR